MADKRYINPDYGNRRFRTHALKYTPDVYNPYILKNTNTLTLKEQRAEYQRLRSIALKRLKTFENTPYTTSNIYRYNVGRYPTLSEIKTESQLAYKLSDLARFLRARTSTLSGMREARRKQIEALNEQGIPETELESFGKFMDLARTMLSEMEYDSEKVVDKYKNMSKKDDDAVQKLVLHRYKQQLKKRGKTRDMGESISRENSRNSEQLRKELNYDDRWKI